MATLGARLREERKKRGLSIAQLAEQTRIHIQYFEAIERDDVDGLPGGFFYRSFVRQYARLMDLPDEAYQAEIQRSLDAEAAHAAARETALPDRSIAVPALPTGRFDPGEELRRWAIRLGILALVILTCGGVYRLWQHFKPSFETAAVRPAAEPPKPAPKPVQAQPVAQQQPQQQPPQPAPEPPPTSVSAPAGSDVRVTIKALEMTWVGVWDGEKQLYADVIHAGVTRGFGSARRLRMRLGNAGGVTMEWNGQTVVPLGPKGQVRTVEFRTDGYSVIQPPPTTETPQP